MLAVLARTRPRVVGLLGVIAAGRARTDRTDRDQIDPGQGPRAREQADQDELGLVAETTTEARVAAVPGDRPDSHEAGPGHRPERVVQAVAVDHDEGDPIGRGFRRATAKIRPISTHDSPLGNQRWRCPPPRRPYLGLGSYRNGIIAQRALTTGGS